MILDSDNNVLSQAGNLLLTPEALISIGATKIGVTKILTENWELTYKGEIRKFNLYRPANSQYKYEASVYVKHYTNEKKTAWLSFGTEYARTLSELLAWYDAEDEFYKDHPEEKYGTPEYERKKKQDEAIGEEFDRMRNHYNTLTYYTDKDILQPSYIGAYPKDNDDAIWWSIYLDAVKTANEKHPELWS